MVSVSAQNHLLSPSCMHCISKRTCLLASLLNQNKTRTRTRSVCFVVGAEKKKRRKNRNQNFLKRKVHTIAKTTNQQTNNQKQNMSSPKAHKVRNFDWVNAALNSIAIVPCWFCCCCCCRLFKLCAFPSCCMCMRGICAVCMVPVLL